ENQISGAPSWISSDRFDIQATPGETVAAEWQKLEPDQRSEMQRELLQSLLAERFKLKLGHETRDVPVYLLTVGKNGPKFHESATSNQGRDSGSDQPRRGIMMNGRGQLTVNDAGIDILTNVLSHQLGRIVLDKTGLRGRYDFTLNWTPEPGEGRMNPGGPGPSREGPSGAAPPPEQSGPSLFTALQEQLGLKLESQKAPVGILVVEHVEKPSEN
ncbi:MAG: TIGR03435 family protein, partial [Acidobacteriaceae bacterium]|nr:TIGR03435 family protein [Acidobacteriaceae bacterium]